jgi:GntR family transcriptional regulator/MocR family aminotransferase
MDVHVSLIGRRDLSGEIYRQLRRAILEGRLRAGEPLPPSRELARRLSVARTTVTVAYERLAGEGYVRSRIGAGTFVSEDATRTTARTAASRRAPGPLRPRAVWNAVPPFVAFRQPAPYDFRTGVPDATLFPHDRWRRLMAHELRTDLSAGLYGDPAGHRPLREAIARHIAVSRGVDATADDITITNGTQQAVDLVARVLLEPGDRVAVEDPGYPPPRRLFETSGARVVGVPVDRDGLVVDDLPRHTRLVYVTPSHQYPLGVSLSLERRRALLAWAERNDAAILEDDYDSEFRFHGRPVEPLHTLDGTGRVIYVGTFSKTLLPALRLGFVVAPPSLHAALHRAKRLTDWHTSVPAQATLARFIDTGEFARHLRRVGAVYRQRHDLLRQALARDLAEHLEAVPSNAGLHVAALSRTASAGRIATVAERAAALGVQVQELARFAVSARPPAIGLLLGYGLIPAADIGPGLALLRAAFEARS